MDFLTLNITINFKPKHMAIPEYISESDLNNDKDWVMVRSMMNFAKKSPQKNLVPINLQSITRKTKLTLIMLPEWGVYFPPYNLSRLAGVSRAAGYETIIHDINIKTWRSLQKTSAVDYWDPNREWMWANSKIYLNEIHPQIEPILINYINQIVESNPDVVGFCMYYTNETVTNWMAIKLRKLLPNAKIIVGGPHVIAPSKGTEFFYDHLIQGEGEQVLLNLLNAVENNQPIGDKFLLAPKTRLDLSLIHI